MVSIFANPRERERPWLHYIRRLEVDKAAQLLRTAQGKRLLEIGGGDGFVARELTNLGFDVTSIDLAPRSPQSYPVQLGDATNLPFEESSFDVIMTCQVLQEIPWPRIFNEMKRVLKPDGIAVHIVPTTQWSLLSNFWHFLLLPIFLFTSLSQRLILDVSRRRTRANPSVGKESHVSTTDAIKEPWTAKQRMKWMFLHPLGFYPSFLHEIILFSNGAWIRLFRRNGFSVVANTRGPILASGQRVFPFKAIRTRQLLSRLFPSSRIFLVRPS
jgi:ubiquinone/menaquinone biosynthesis C-methylase UbiE